MAPHLLWVIVVGLAIQLGECQLTYNYDAYAEIWDSLFSTSKPKTTTTPKTTPTTTTTTTTTTRTTTTTTPAFTTPIIATATAELYDFTPVYAAPTSSVWSGVQSVTPDPCIHVYTMPNFTEPEEKKTNKTIDELIEEASTGKNMLHKQGVFLVELDMVLTPYQLTKLKPKYASQLGVTAMGLNPLRPTIRPWNQAVIPYEFKKGHFNCDDKYFILKIMSEIQKKTCITFRPVLPYDTNSLRFVSRDGCWSYLGMRDFGKQDVSLRRDGCIHRSVIRHALGHAVGLVNEHNMPDRNKYLRIFWGRIPMNRRYNLIKYPEESFQSFDTKYSFYSAMQFSSKAFSVTGTRTLQTKDATKHHIIEEPVREYSFSDLKTMNSLYNCAARCILEVECEEPGYLDKNCKCVCPCGYDCGIETENEVCKNMIADETCMKMAAAGECQSNPQAMITICCAACNGCHGGVPCGDYNKACGELAHRGACLSMRPYMSIFCQASCKMCPP